MERNIEALRELRRVAEAAPEDLLHMHVITEKAPCGTAHCLMGWAMIDPYFCALPNFPRREGDWDSMVLKAAKALGLNSKEAHLLFASGLARGSDPHDIGKGEVLWNLDQLIAGKPPLPYRNARAWNSAGYFVPR
jgi:hypothetical protein